MKYTTFFLFLFPMLLNAQISMQFRSGYNHSAFLAIAPVMAYNGFTVAPELIINIKKDAPVSPGIKISYQYKFIELGYGRYYDVYSMDKYDAYRNQWSNLFFVSGHYNKWFIEIGYNKRMSFSVGVRELFSNM